MYHFTTLDKLYKLQCHAFDHVNFVSALSFHRVPGDRCKKDMPPQPNANLKKWPFPFTVFATDDAEILRGILKESDASPKKKLKPCPDVRPTVVSECSKKKQALSWKWNAAKPKHVTSLVHPNIRTIQCWSTWLNLFLFLFWKNALLVIFASNKKIRKSSNPMLFGAGCKNLCFDLKTFTFPKTTVANAKHSTIIAWTFSRRVLQLFTKM